MINVSNLSFRYSKKKLLFENLNLMLAPGHIYGLLGKNGAGKSTLLHLLSGLLHPQNGAIDILGHQPQSRAIEFLQNSFLLPEEFYLPQMSVCKYARLHAPFYPNFDFELFDRILTEFEVNGKEHLHSLSMGQRKKAYISFALATCTQMLWMDEPTNGLDIPSKTQFRKIMASVATDDKCIVISTHQVRDLDSLIDSMIVVDDQQIVFNQDLHTISQKLQCVSFNEKDRPDNVLYEEKRFAGNRALIANNGSEEGMMDMELLFNAIVGDREKITHHFNTTER